MRPALRRSLRIALVAVAALCLIAIAAVILLVRSLDQSWLKRRLQAAARAKVGAEVDWSATRVSPLSGLHLDGLTILTPPAERGRAPELLHVGSVDLAWTPTSLLGTGPKLLSLTAHDLSLTLVRQEDGSTSLSSLGSSDSGAPEGKPPPPSHLLEGLLGSAPPARSSPPGPRRLLVEKAPKPLPALREIAPTLTRVALLNCVLPANPV